MQRIEQAHTLAKQVSVARFVHTYGVPVLVAHGIMDGRLTRMQKDLGAPQERRSVGRVQAVGRPFRAANSGDGHGTLHLESVRIPANLSRSESKADIEKSKPAPLLSRPQAPDKPFSQERIARIQPRNHSKTPYLTVGRSSNMDVVINDYTISKRHARIYLKQLPFRALIEDVGSTNGTKHNAEPLQSNQWAVLNSGDSVQLGRVLFTYFEPRDLYGYLLGINAEDLADIIDDMRFANDNG